MQPHELDAYLDGTDITDDQRDQLLEAADTIEARYPAVDIEDSRRAAFAAAVQVVLGDDTTDSLAAKWFLACNAERQAMAALTGALIVDERSDLALTTELGIARNTVRKARGK